MARVREALRYLRESLWFIPSLFAVGALVLAGIMLLVDENFRGTGEVPFMFGGSVEGAREVLSTIAMSMLTFTGLVFTITMLVLQAASNQLTPRVLRTFLRDRSNQAVLGLFVATFLFALVVLRYTRSPEENSDAFVPGISIGTAFILLVASIGAFIYYIDHMAHSIRASTVIHNIATETRAAIRSLFPDPVGEPEEGSQEEARTGTAEHDQRATAAIPTGRPSHVVRAPDAGVLAGVDEGALIKSIGRPDAEAVNERFVEMVPLVGDYVAEGSPVFRVWGEWDEEELDGLQGAIETGRERTMDSDAAYGVRQLVDIAVRALSPGVNDPTTAIQALDRIHDLLHRLVQRRIPSPLRRDPTGQGRLFLRRPAWEDYLLLAVEEIRLSAEGQVHVLRRLRQMLLDVLLVAPDERRPPIEAAIERVDRSAARSLDDELDRRIARPTHPYGQGPMAT